MSARASLVCTSCVRVSLSVGAKAYGNAGLTYVYKQLCVCAIAIVCVECFECGVCDGAGGVPAPPRHRIPSYPEKREGRLL